MTRMKTTRIRKLVHANTRYNGCPKNICIWVFTQRPRSELANSPERAARRMKFRAAGGATARQCASVHTVPVCILSETPIGIVGKQRKVECVYSWRSTKY